MTVSKPAVISVPITTKNFLTSFSHNRFQWQDSNPRPLEYGSGVLPLSYRGDNLLRKILYIQPMANMFRASSQEEKEEKYVFFLTDSLFIIFYISSVLSGAKFVKHF
jgi:hypothetical protein